MRFQAYFPPLIRTILWLMATISLVGLIVGIAVLAGLHLEVTIGQATLLISVCSFTLIIALLLATIHYKVDATHLHLNIGFVDMLSGRIRINNILNIVIDNEKMYISYFWKGPDPVIALVAINPKRYSEMKDILMAKNKNIFYYENDNNEITNSEQQ